MIDLDPEEVRLFICLSIYRTKRPSKYDYARNMLDFALKAAGKEPGKRGVPASAHEW